MSDNISAKCNCGSPIRYSYTNGQCSCNKYEVCLPYDKLAAEHAHYRRLAMMYCPLYVNTTQYLRSGLEAKQGWMWQD